SFRPTRSGPFAHHVEKNRGAAVRSSTAFPDGFCLNRSPLLVISQGHAPIPSCTEPRAIVKPGHVDEIVIYGDADVIASEIVHPAAPANSGRWCAADFERRAK